MTKLIDHEGSVTILLFKGKGWISRLIRWQTRSIYSHAAILVGVDTIIEAWQGTGVRKKKITRWDDIDAFRIYCSDRQKKDVIEFLHKQLGKKYDYRSVFRFLIKIPAGINDKWFCSELAFDALLTGRMQVLNNIEPEEVSPAHLRLPVEFTQIALLASPC